MASMSTKKILEVQIAANHQHQRREQRDEAKDFNISTGSRSLHPPVPRVSSSIYIYTSLFSLLSILFLYTTTRTIFIFFWLDDLLYCIVFSREAEEKGHSLINLCLVTFYRSKISLKKCNIWGRIIWFIFLTGHSGRDRNLKRRF